MSDVTIGQLAQVLGMPTENLISQLSEAEMIFSDASQIITSSEKIKLLSFLRRTQGKRDEMDRQERTLSAPEGSMEEADLELEPEDETLQIENPFDPEKIKVRTVTKTVDLLVRRIDHGEIDLAPEFQRRARVWNDRRKSRLIESVLLRIPLPVFYVAADALENWAVVDGLQRTTTIYDFMKGKFELTNLEYLSRLNGSYFSGLPRQIQRRIEETELVIHVIEPGTPESVMINIFKRINTGGVSLTGQEIRNALNRGPVREFLRVLASGVEFRSATDGTVSDSRMDAQECVLRFAAFMLNDWNSYQSNDLDGFLNAAMRRINEISQVERDELALSFSKAMHSAREIFGRFAFRKIYDVGVTRRNPVSKALFEAWSVNLAKCSEAETKFLIGKRKYVLEMFAKEMRDNKFFDVSVSTSTGVPQRVWARFGTVAEIIAGAMK